MKDVFFVYNTSCFYEIVILAYFMNFPKSARLKEICCFKKIMNLQTRN